MGPWSISRLLEDRRGRGEGVQGVGLGLQGGAAAARDFVSVVLALFVVSLVIRWSAGDYRAPGSILAIELVALGLALVGGWLGGELVERLGVGVDPGAHLDAPSSLSDRPTTAQPADRQA